MKESCMYENMLIISKNVFWKRKTIILCEVYVISGWGIWTFYLIKKNSNLESSTTYLFGVDMIKIANSKLITKTYFIW